MIIFAQEKGEGKPSQNIKLIPFLCLSIKQRYLNQYKFSVHVPLGEKKVDGCITNNEGPCSGVCVCVCLRLRKKL